MEGMGGHATAWGHISSCIPLVRPTAAILKIHCGRGCRCGRASGCEYGWARTSPRAWPPDWSTAAAGLGGGPHLPLTPHPLINPLTQPLSTTLPRPCASTCQAGALPFATTPKRTARPNHTHLLKRDVSLPRRAPPALRRQPPQRALLVARRHQRRPRRPAQHLRQTHARACEQRVHCPCLCKGLPPCAPPSCSGTSQRDLSRHETNASAPMV